MTTRQKLFLTCFYTLLIGGFFSYFISAHLHKIKSVNMVWYDYEEHAESSKTALQNIKYQMGYGGLIHNFKNYVLRFNPRYRMDAMANGAEILVYVDRLYSLTHEDDIEIRKQLGVFRDVVQQYMNNLDVTASLIAQDKTMREIDAEVKIDDVGALSALQYVTLAVEEHYKGHHEEFQRALKSLNHDFIVNLPLLVFISLIGFVGIAMIKTRDEYPGAP